MMKEFENYAYEVKKLYEERMDATEDDNLKSAYTSIMTEEFRAYDEELHECIREGTARLTEQAGE